MRRPCSSGAAPSRHLLAELGLCGRNLARLAGHRRSCWAGTASTPRAGF